MKFGSYFRQILKVRTKISHDNIALDKAVLASAPTRIITE